MIKLKQQINKVDLFKKIEKEAEESYDNSHARIQFMVGARAMFNLLRDNKTKVTIETFKESGKVDDPNKVYYSEFEPEKSEEITAEVKEKFKITGDFTVEVESGNDWNKWLVINDKS